MQNKDREFWNQRVETGQILRTQLNCAPGLQASLDTLAAYKNAEFLAGGESGAAAACVGAALLDVDWAQYRAVLLDVRIPDGSAPDLLSAPGGAQSYTDGCLCRSGRLARLGGGAWRGVLPVLHDPDRPFVSLLWGGGILSGSARTTYRETAALYLYDPRRPLPAHTALRLWGVRE